MHAPSREERRTAAARFRARASASSVPRELAPARNDWAPSTAYARLGRPLLRVALLVLCLPPALLLALPIALSNALQFGGPRGVFFRQRRVGLHGRVFRIVKFRTLHGATQDGDAWDPRDDRRRVTRFGQLLRNTHLDELPQLWNILCGEMDFIGPRPEMEAIDRWACGAIRGFRARNAVLPGLTGLAQVTQGYTECDVAAYRRKLLLDRCSMARLSFAFDLEILLRTALWVARARGWQRRARRLRGSG